MKFQDYSITIRLTEPMLGTVPKDPEVYARYIATKAPAPMLAQQEIDAEKAREDVEKTGWTGFHQNERGLYIYNYMILGFLKEAGNVLKEQLGIKNLRSKIDNYVYIEPRCIYVAKEPAGVLERPLRGMTAQGPRVTVVRSDYISAGTEISFDVRILENKEVTIDVVKEIFQFGKMKGLGQFRNGSYGRFELLSAEPIEQIA